MKLTAKQQEIKDRVLGEENAVLRNDVGTGKAIEILNSIEDWDWNGHYKFYGNQYSDSFVAILEEEVKDRPIINMSEWFKEDLQGTREYDEKLSKAEFNHLLWVYDRLISVHKENINSDYMIQLASIIDKLKPIDSEELLKEKEELEARLKEINEKLKL